MKQDREPVRPSGGLAASQRALRKWKWQRPSLSAPVRCKRESWYLLRAQAETNGVPARVGVQFLADEDPVSARTVQLTRSTAGEGGTLVGWIQAPPDATHLQVELYGDTPPLEQLTLYPAAERDPKCHPYANTPAWSTYKSPFPIETVYVPESLAGLSEYVTGPKVQVTKPRSLAALQKTVSRNALILDRDLVKQLGLDYAGLLRLAANSWVVVDLDTLAALVRYASLADAKVETHRASHDIMSARVEYADVPTRGFALFDVIPYAVVDKEGGFATRVLRANKSWKRFADKTGFATLLSSETPWSDKCGDILSAARPVEKGELIGCDLPWLVAGAYSPPLAPQLTRHLLNMHLGGPIEEGLQYWNRWEDGGIVLRDIADLARRYPTITTLRWAGDKGNLRLGLAVGGGQEPKQTLLLQTGRIDTLAPHDGVAPEPMMILMKWLGRCIFENNDFARRYLASTRVVWQFESADGLRHATHFRAAPKSFQGVQQHSLRAGPVTRITRTGNVFEVPSDLGVHGDGSLAFQSMLTTWLRKQLKSG